MKSINEIYEEIISEAMPKGYPRFQVNRWNVAIVTPKEIKQHKLTNELAQLNYLKAILAKAQTYADNIKSRNMRPDGTWLKPLKDFRMWKEYKSDIKSLKSGIINYNAIVNDLKKKEKAKIKAQKDAQVKRTIKTPKGSNGYVSSQLLPTVVNNITEMLNDNGNRPKPPKIDKNGNYILPFTVILEKVSVSVAMSRKLSVNIGYYINIIDDDTISIQQRILPKAKWKKVVKKSKQLNIWENNDIEKPQKIKLTKDVAVDNKKIMIKIKKSLLSHKTFPKEIRTIIFKLVKKAWNLKESSFEELYDNIITY